MRLDTLLQLTLWVAGSHAFFPYIPEYVCEEDKSCPTKSRRRGSDDGTVTFPLSQRVPDASETHDDRVLRAARYLSGKYSRSRPVPNSGGVTELERRQNNKYTVSKAATPSTPDSTGLHQDGSDLSYFIDVGLGSGSKSVYMLLDSGAGTTWVMGSTCKTSACLAHNSFGPDDSTSFKDAGKPFSVSYGTGSVTGHMATDSLSIAGKKVTMSFGVANSTSDDFNHFAFDGILGLSMAMGATDNLVQVLKREKTLKSNVFGVYISRNADGPNTGEITFGGTDPAKYTGAVSYTSVSGKASGDWAIPLDDFAYDGNKAGLSGRLAYIDTGTTYLFGPPADVATVHKQIPGAKSADGTTYTAPCDTSKPLTVSFGGVSYTIQTRDWLSGPSASGDCVSNLYGLEVVKGAFLLGDVFLKNVYAVFDADQSRIGFASRAAVPSSSAGAATTTTMAPSDGSTSSKAAASTLPTSLLTVLVPSHAAPTPAPAQPAGTGSQQSAGPSSSSSSDKKPSPASHARVCGYVLAAASIFASAATIVF